MANKTCISIVVPLHNEQDNLPTLFAEISAEMERQFCDFELILVDDGSTDRSVEVARELHLNDPRVKLLVLSRNFGKQTAMFAGIEHANGDAVVVMDADLQHPPAVVSQMIAAWKEGNDVVFAVQRHNEGATALSRAASKLFARFFRWLVRLPRTPHASDFVLMDRTVVQQMREIRERNRFFRYLVAWTGFRQIAIPYVAARRLAGTTKFKPRQLAGLAVDALTAFTSAPLRLCTYMGFLVALGCFPYTLWAIYLRLFTDRYVPGWPALIVAVLFLGAVQLIGLGILGEYIGRIYDEVKGRPLYIISERVGCGSVAHGRPAVRRTVAGHSAEAEERKPRVLHSESTH